MIKIGVVNIDVSHPKAFCEYLLKGNRARYTAVYNDGFRGDNEVEAFMKKYGLEKRCRTVDELAESVDIGFIQGCNWDRHLEYAKPFVLHGKPVFIDKPVVGNIADCNKAEQLVSEGAVILGSSSVRYAEEIVNFLNIPEEDRGKVVNVFGTSGVDDFNYGIHIVEAIGGILGTGALSCRFAGKAVLEGNICETYYITFQNGAGAVYNLFMDTWQPFEIVVMTTKSTYRFSIDVGKIYGALLDRICDYMEKGVNTLAPVCSINESVKIMLAGRLSRQNGGIEFYLKDIPSDDPGFDGGVFEKDYASRAARIYL